MIRNALLFGLVLWATPAVAACPPGGGSDQTSEDPLANWQAPESPGSVVAGLESDDLLLTEVAMGPGRESFIEIYNPTGGVIALDDYYLTDYSQEGAIPGQPYGYFNLPEAGFRVWNSADFVVRFPSGATIAPGEVQLIYPGSMPFPQPSPHSVSYEIVDASGPSVPQMIAVGGTPAANLATGLLFQNTELVLLFKWNGACDLVCDVDYFYWGTGPGQFNRVFKGGVAVDGPDPDTEATHYALDTEVFKQTPAMPSVRRARSSVGFNGTEGNGCTRPLVPVTRTTWSSIKAYYRAPR